MNHSTISTHGDTVKTFASSDGRTELSGDNLKCIISLRSCRNVDYGPKGVAGHEARAMGALLGRVDKIVGL